MYSSFAGMVIFFLLTIFIILFLAEKKALPQTLLVNFFKHLFTDYRFTVTILLMLAVLLVNKYELVLENKMTFITWSFTQFVHSYEGDLGVYIQKLENMPTTALLSFMYVYVFPALVWVSLIYYKFKDDDVAVRRTFFAFLLNYIIAFPFYLFVPVDETWFGNPHVHLLIAKAYPAFNTNYRQFSGLNNDFPSLHTSISWSLALVAVSLNYKRFARLLLACASLVAFATLYLGIHWMTDVVGGLVLASIVVVMATRLSYKEFVPEFNLVGLKKKVITAKEYLFEITTNLFS